MQERFSTQTQILDTAQHLVQTRGFNGFSYADISAKVGIKKASIHYHFPSKSDLGKELVQRYREQISLQRLRIDLVCATNDERLVAYVQVFRDILCSGLTSAGGSMCLAGALACDLSALPAIVQHEVQLFFEENAEWLGKLLEGGRASGCIDFKGDAFIEAEALLAVIEGSMIIARVTHDVNRYCATIHQFLGCLGVESALRPV